MAENGGSGGFPPGGPASSGPPGGPAGSSAWQAQNETNLAAGMGGGYRGIRGVSSTGTTVSSMSDPMNLPPMTPASLVPGNGYQAPPGQYSPPNQYSQPNQAPVPVFQTPRQIYMAYNGPSTPAVAEMGGHSANDSRTLSGVSEIGSMSDGRPHDTRSLGGISALTMQTQDDPRHVSGVPVAQSPVPQRKAVPSRPEIGGGSQTRYEMA
ncbi:hypothetical protein BGZ60DRAFT_399324 [Tricladium varicosporioides]|nr:hypothetical protein BGZ60DRAFT_399324 [Hymenoscyphus varicosporioides]